MGINFSQDIVPMADLKVNPGKVLRHVADAHRPVLLTNRGRGVAVEQSVANYEAAEEERAFMPAVIAGHADFDAGLELSLEEAQVRLDPILP